MMSKKKVKSDLEKFGISVHLHQVKREITKEDLTKDLVKEIGNKISITDNNNGGEFNN